VGLIRPDHRAMAMANSLALVPIACDLALHGYFLILNVSVFERVEWMSSGGQISALLARTGETCLHAHFNTLMI